MKFYITSTLIAVLIVLPIYLFFEYEKQIFKAVYHYFAKPNWQLAIEGKLVDPESAKFKDVVVNPIDGSICGKVNARNSFGGYSGYKTFLIIPSLDDQNTVWRTLIEGGQYDGLVKKHCYYR